MDQRADLGTDTDAEGAERGPLEVRDRQTCRGGATSSPGSTVTAGSSASRPVRGGAFARLRAWHPGQWARRPLPGPAGVKENPGKTDPCAQAQPRPACF